MWDWPVTLSIVSALAPAPVKSTLMSGAFIALFLGTVIMGWVGSFYDQMTPPLSGRSTPRSRLAGQC